MSKRITKRLTNEPVGIGDGARTVFAPTFLGKPTRLATEITSIYRRDWRGRQRLSREPRTNFLADSDVTASSIGRVPSVGNFPPGWVTVVGPFGGWTREIVGKGVLPDGTPYVDYRLWGASNASYVRFFDIVFQSAPVPASRGSIWTVSVGLQVIAGDPEAGFREPLRQLVLAECDRNGQYLVSSTSTKPNPTTLQRLSVTRKLSHDDVAGIKCYIGMAVSPNSSVDVTLRISQPQLEPTSAATPYIPTRGGARTVIDYVLDERKQIHLGEAPPIGATLTWDGSVGVDVGTSLLPPNATTLERTAEAVTARSFDIDTVVGLLWNPATCPENLLPWLAWTMSVDTWRNSWPLAVKRARVANSLIVQRRKGTARSIADVVDSFGGVVDITEWWQTKPRGAPHTFALTLTLGGQDGETTTAQYVDDVIAEVNFTKPVRSHFTFTQGINLAARVGVIAATRAAVFVRLQATEATTP
ncbi:phage tail protein I [Microbacterium sp. CGR1]|uniref:phage tail protein I n=1 Tax=Microbacterium sp. CGR1 TaxID=1696072 RepID=UPI003DA62FE1